MANNLDYFEISAKHKERLIDPDYHKIVNRLVIPLSKSDKNDLTISNEKVIRYIDTIYTLLELKHSMDDLTVEDVILKIIEELKTSGMNYSALCQYFNVHNMNYSIFSDLPNDQKMAVLKYIVQHYIEDRHKIYSSHGYSNIVLQVMSDNYSHKRKGIYGTNKIADVLRILDIPDLAKARNQSFDQNEYYLLSDKTGKALYKKFVQQYGIRISDEGRETEKYPDALIKIGGDFFVVEQKNMKENGGGQDKQTIEITKFIDRTPEFDGLHYVTYVDGIYFNQIDHNSTAKTKQQYDDVIKVLNEHKNNFFVNSYGFEQLINDVYKSVRIIHNAKHNAKS